MSDTPSPINPACAACDLPPAQRTCMSPKGKGPENCPTLTQRPLLKEANQAYASDPIRTFAKQASCQEAACYANRQQKPYVLQPTKSRIVEICEFAHRMRYDHLGLAFCIGLRSEARQVAEVFQTNDLKVTSVACKAGRTPKSDLDLASRDTIALDSREAMCNPVFQARLLNRQETQLNVLLGLCVGHDSLFFKYAQAPTTVLAVKDRVTGHNPLAAIYLCDSYYAKIKKPDPWG